MKKVLVTGARGFLGRHVVAALLRSPVDVLNPSHDDLDLQDPQRVASYFRYYSPDVVIHCAGRVGGIRDNAAHPADFMLDNLAMGVNVVHACLNYGVARLVMIGTTCSYPASAPCPMSEDDLWDGPPVGETGAYGIAKRTLFDLCDAAFEQYGLEAVSLIPTNLYGPGDKSTHVVPELIWKFRNQNPVTVMGTGTATRDFLYVEDAADAICTAALCYYPGPSPINLGTGVETSIQSLAGQIQVATGQQATPVIFMHSAIEGQARRVLDTSRAKVLLGWTATTALEDGLRKTIARKESCQCEICSTPPGEPATT